MPAGTDPLIPYLLVVCVVLAAFVALLAIRLHGLARRIAGVGGDASLLGRLAAVERELGAASSRLDHLGGRLDRMNEQMTRCLQRVGVVRYDAFKELGGHLSFSIALLDSRQDGIVVSALNDREGARVYAKPIAGGRSTFTLSEEEQHAIAQA